MRTTPFILSISMTPKPTADLTVLDSVLAELAQQSFSLRVQRDSLTGGAVLFSAGEEELDTAFDRIWRACNREVVFGRPEVIYIETISAAAEAEGRYIRQAGGTGNYGHCWLRVEPNARGEGYEFHNRTAGGVIPRQFIDAINQGVREAMRGGVLGGHEIVDVTVTLFDGSVHDTDSNEMAFQIAASMAFKEAARKAMPVLLEPVMEIEVIIPEEYMGKVIQDLRFRRGRIDGIDALDETQSLRATVPMATMFGYAPNLRASTQGHASYKVRFKQYEVCAEDQGPGFRV